MSDIGGPEVIVPPPPQIDAESGQLRLLAVFHFAVAGLDALGSVLGLFYILLGAAGIADGFNQPGNEAFDFVGGTIFILGGFAFSALTLVFAGCLLYAGVCLQRQQRWRYCFAIAVLSCASLMFCVCGLPNLILGIVTMVFLLKPSVKLRFGVGP